MKEKIVDSAAALIGGTPLLRLKNTERALGLSAEICAKLEFFNPAGSVKDRVALKMILDAEHSGRLKPGATIIEPTSGNTGIGLASVAAARGYRAVIVMPDTMSEERRTLMRAYGATLVLSDGKKGMAGAIEEAERIARETPNSIIAGQFTNPANPQAHYESTGPEIYEDAAGRVDCFIAGIGTGGTVSGVGRYLKERLPSVKIVGVEPASSPLLTKGQAGAHGLQGIGANFVPETLDRSVIDEILTVTEEEAFEAVRALGRTEGILVGISSGAALSAAYTLARRPDMEGKRIVVLLPDTGDRYLSTSLFE
ncbi:MAG: cysteine synthase A [Clostridia bacterium]|nr:cysteine synthase A [Clostridia bacterium]